MLHGICRVGVLVWLWRWRRGNGTMCGEKVALVALVAFLPGAGLVGLKIK